MLATWVGIGMLTVLYLLGYFRFEHDSPVEHVSALRIGVVIVFLTATLYLATGMFGGGLGELDSFLPPAASDLKTPAEGVTSNGELAWIQNDYETARKNAREENKPLFINFTGYTCTNCRWMEANMFPRPEVRRELEKFVRVKIYTDGVGELFERQQKMQQERFKTVALPLYAIVYPDGITVATFPGLTRDSAQFVAFLQRARRS